jgi:hypothetical protein
VPALATYARVYVEDLDIALPTFIELTGEQPRMRFAYRGLEIAGIGGFVLLAGTDEVLAPYRGTHASAIVESVTEVARSAKENGGEVLDGPNEGASGLNLTVRHPGGATIEYIEPNAAARAAVTGATS